jgi:hypothetical protein
MASSFVHDAEALAALEATYDALCVAHPLDVGKLLSSSERDARGLSASTLVYGEINFVPFGITFQKLKKLYGGLTKPGGVFVDVGSGTGKPVFAACLLHPFAAARGIEILEGLHKGSLELHDEWKSPAIQSALPVGHGVVDISFICGDATTWECSFADADVLFMNSTCFSEALMLALAAIAEGMKKGSYAITFTRKLPSLSWRVLDSTIFTMSWGNATVFLQVKT